MRVSTNHMQNTGVQNMTGQARGITDTQTQLASGRRVLRPSDDPPRAARSLDLERAVQSVERFNRNVDLARTRLNLSEAAMDQAGNQLQRIRELAVQAANDSQDRRTRSYIASEVRERFRQLVQLANSQDGNGEYLFAGAKTRTRPFSMGPDETVTYLGDQNQRQVRIGPGRQIAVDNSGFDAFMKVYHGNASYDARQHPDNSGTGVVTVVDRGVQRFDPHIDEYRVRFAEDDQGRLRYAVEKTSDITDPGGWEWVVPTGGENGEAPSITDAPTYEPGATVELDDGIRVVLDGDPDPGADFSTADPGDTFHVRGSRPQSIFDTIKQFLDALEEDGEGPGFRNGVNRTIGDIDLGLENTFRVRAELGARMSTLDTEEAGNRAALVDLRSALSREQDLDYAEATGRFNQELTGLKAAQMSFSRVQDLSLFNYI